MNQKTTARCTEVVAPTLSPGEQIELAEAVQIGKVSAKRRAATAAAVSIATAGTVMVALKPRGYYLILTNQRLILLDNIRGRVGKAWPLRRGAWSAPSLFAPICLPFP